jgi:hypothetical protein
VASRLGAPADIGLTFVGIIMTGFGLTLHQSANARVPLCIGVMGVGTALVLAGLYASGWPHQRLPNFLKRHAELEDFGGLFRAEPEVCSISSGQAATLMHAAAGILRWGRGWPGSIY